MIDMTYDPEAYAAGIYLGRGKFVTGAVPISPAL